MVTVKNETFDWRPVMLALAVAKRSMLRISMNGTIVLKNSRPRPIRDQRPCSKRLHNDTSLFR
jgi:hypothetical protein